MTEVDRLDVMQFEEECDDLLWVPRPIAILLPKPGLHVALDIAHITYSIRKSKLNN